MGATNSIEKKVVLETGSKGSLTGLQQIDAATGKLVCTRYARIPFALPPIGERRWKRPVHLPANFSFDGPGGKPGDYIEFGPVCPQPVYDHDSILLPNPAAGPEPPRTESEDCLYLNIWIPAGEVPEGGWPVQFFIHGGWLQVGDAMQNNKYDPYDLLKEFPRIVVAPTYRLNLFGFMACSELATEISSHAPGNYGFWDQRMALEWTYANINLFSGNKDNITVGGLSAGAYSTVFQLHYDTCRPDPKDRLIKRVVLFSNAVGIQPRSVHSSASQAQFEELLTALQIPLALSATERLSSLRGTSSKQLVAAIHSLKSHTFRAGTDDDFIPSGFLSSIHDGSFTTVLHDQKIQILLGEVSDEELLYRLVNPPSSYDDMIVQINNYYPPFVTSALLKTYPMPPLNSSSTIWRDIGAKIIGDCQVHATIRGFAKSLIEPPTGARALNIDQVFRYRISWRAKCLDEWFEPDAKVTHSADMPIWWLSGVRAGFTDEDMKQVRLWLEPFERFLWGGMRGEIDWGTHDVREIREFQSDGQILVVKDALWDRGIEVWKTMLNAEFKSKGKEH